MSKYVGIKAHKELYRFYKIMCYSCIVFKINFMYTSLIMNSEAIMREFVSRPKINRLPLPPARVSFNYTNILDDKIVKSSLGIAAAFAVLLIIYQYVSELFVTTSPPADDKYLLELVNSSMEPVRASESTLYFRDSDGFIVGNIIRIASESEKTIPDKVYSTSGATTESELLSILSKY